MSDWEDFCESRGWKNDESAYDKLERMINDGHSNYSSTKNLHARGREFSPKEKKQYAKRMQEERRLLERPAAKVVRELLRWGIKTIREDEIEKDGKHYKRLTILEQQSNMDITAVIMLENNTIFEVSFSDSITESEATVRAPRLTRALIKDAYVQWLAQWNPLAADHHWITSDD